MTAQGRLPPHSFQSHDGTTISYVKGGKGSRVLIAVHGAGSNHSTWLNALRQLRGVRWYAFDTRGHGRSGGAPDIKKSAEDIITLADKEGIKHFAVAGICYGGSIVLEAARRHPGRINKVIILSPLDRKLVSLTGPLRFACAAIGAVAKRLPLRPKTTYVDYCEKPGLPFMFTFFEDLTGTHTRHYAQAALQCIDTQVDFRIRQPLLVISGSHDLFLRGNVLRQRLAMHGNHKHLQVPTNHHVLTWRPQKTGRLMNDFLAGRQH
jgi:pimeloyl-ACP methyl ester carboxylesterase